MCKGGGSTSTVNPQIMQMLQSNYSNAQNVANRPYQPYTGQLTAGLTPSQLQAGGLLQSAPGMGQGALGAGVNAAAAGTQYQAPQIAPPSASAATAQPGLLSGVNTMTPSLMNAASAGPAAQANAATINPGGLNINSFLNPYQSNVVNSTMNLLNQQQAQALNSTNQRATGENAFGGDRSGVADALTNQYYAQQAADTLANLNSQGFNTALNSALNVANSNAANQQQTNLANAGAANNMAQFNAGLLNTANLDNQAAANAADQYNAGALNQGAQFNASNQQAANLANQGAANQMSLANLNAALAAYGLVWRADYTAGVDLRPLVNRAMCWRRTRDNAIQICDGGWPEYSALERVPRGEVVAARFRAGFDRMEPFAPERFLRRGQERPRAASPPDSTKKTRAKRAGAGARCVAALDRSAFAKATADSFGHFSPAEAFSVGGCTRIALRAAPCGSPRKNRNAD